MPPPGRKRYFYGMTASSSIDGGAQPALLGEVSASAAWLDGGTHRCVAGMPSKIAATATLMAAATQPPRRALLASWVIPPVDSAVMLSKYILLACCASVAFAAQSAATQGDAVRGKEIYESRCFACHAVDANRVGPMHLGVFGRKAGSVEGFDYSPAVKKSRIKWDDKTLDRWLANPEKLIPGQRMAFQVSEAADRTDIIAYLKTLDGMPPVQYRSPAGVEYRSLPETDAIKGARTALEADPKNAARFIDLGVAQSGARQFREAIATFTRGLEVEPNNALLLRWRGHRYLSVREFDRAFADLMRGSTIDAGIYGIWYHLGVVQYIRGEFADAAASFAKAQPIAPDAGELAGSTDWLWMSLSRAGRGAEAKAMLDRRPDSKPVNNAYTRRLQLYRGEIGPEAVVTSADTEDVQIATLSYGLGNWYWLKGNKTQARKWFERSIQSGGWPGFGFIVSEVELRRLRKGK
jgi:cytochrome c2